MSPSLQSSILQHDSVVHSVLALFILGIHIVCHLKCLCGYSVLCHWIFCHCWEIHLYVPIVSTYEISIFIMETIVLAFAIILEVISIIVLILLTYPSAICTVLWYSTSSASSEIVISFACIWTSKFFAEGCFEYCSVLSCFRVTWVNPSGSTPVFWNVWWNTFGLVQLFDFHMLCHHFFLSCVLA